MPTWNPSPDWLGQDAILIGGGPSLASFDFSKIKGRNVIGVNDAFRLGPDIVKICIFGDSSWFHHNTQELEKFTGLIISLAPSLAQVKIPWLHQAGRLKMGLQTGPNLGWNYSTGAAAINLAISLGATRIFLLGYDLGNSPTGKVHWHNFNEKEVKEFSYRRFQAGFGQIHKDLVKFPSVKVINVSNGSSKLAFFPVITFETFLSYVPHQHRPPCAPCEERARTAQQAAAP